MQMRRKSGDSLRRYALINCRSTHQSEKLKAKAMDEIRGQLTAIMYRIDSLSLKELFKEEVFVDSIPLQVSFSSQVETAMSSVRSITLFLDTLSVSNTKPSQREESTDPLISELPLLSESTSVPKGLPEVPDPEVLDTYEPNVSPQLMPDFANLFHNTCNSFTIVDTNKASDPLIPKRRLFGPNIVCTSTPTQPQTQALTRSLSLPNVCRNERNDWFPQVIPLAANEVVVNEDHSWPEDDRSRSSSNPIDPKPLRISPPSSTGSANDIVMKKVYEVI